VSGGGKTVSYGELVKGQQLKLTIPVAAGSLALTGFAPTLKFTIPVAAASLVLTGYAPTVRVGTLLQPASVALTLTGFAPTVVNTTPDVESIHSIFRAGPSAAGGDVFRSAQSPAGGKMFR